MMFEMVDEQCQLVLREVLGQTSYESLIVKRIS